MKRRSLPNRLWAFAAAATLVFSQVAMATFAPPSRTAAMVEARLEGAPCHREDPGTQHLCIKKNCQEDAQKDEPLSCAVAAPPSTDGVRVDPPRDPDLLTCASPEPVLARATSPPTEILFSRRLE